MTDSTAPSVAVLTDVTEIAYAIATDLFYDDIINFIKLIDRVVADSVFTEMLKEAVDKL